MQHTKLTVFTATDKTPPDLLVRVIKDVSRKTIDGLLEIAYGYSKLKQFCNARNLSFTDYAISHLDTNKTTATKLAKIGDDFDRMFYIKDRLPISYNSIYEITLFTDTYLKYLIDNDYLHSSLSYKEIRKMKENFTTQKFDLKPPLTLREALKRLNLNHFLAYLIRENELANNYTESELIEAANIIWDYVEGK